MKKNTYYLVLTILSIALALNLLLTPLIGAIATDQYEVQLSTGPSMGHNIGGLYIADTEYNQLYNGDVVIFENKCGQHVRHRLIYDDRSEEWRTWGDGNPAYDHTTCYKNAVHPSDDEYFIGRVVFSINY